MLPSSVEDLAIFAPSPASADSSMEPLSPAVHSPSPSPSYPSSSLSHRASAQSTPIKSSQSPPPLRRSSRPSTKPKWLHDYVATAVTTIDVHYALSTYIKPKFLAFLAALTASSDPILFQDAVKEEKWCTAINAELEASKQNHTWEITSLSPSRNVISCIWLYKTKFNLDGTVNKYKARLVIQGCRQRQGVDYHETFAPVA